MSTIEMAITFFLIANPFGNSPAIIALIKDFPFERQMKIMVRETFLALFLALFFQYLGQVFLGKLAISLYTLKISGGILLLLVALDMIFSPPNHLQKTPLKKEPLFVPIATPLLSGPALLSIIMVYSKDVNDPYRVSLAIALAWIGVATALLAAPYINRILKKRGLIALSQLMGLFLTMLAVEMIVPGIKEFITELQKT